MVPCDIVVTAVIAVCGVGIESTHERTFVSGVGFMISESTFVSQTIIGGSLGLAVLRPRQCLRREMYFVVMVCSTSGDDPDFHCVFLTFLIR